MISNYNQHNTPPHLSVNRNTTANLTKTFTHLKQYSTISLYLRDDTNCSVPCNTKERQIRKSNHHHQSDRHKMIITSDTRNKKSTIRIGNSSHLESIRVRQIWIRRRHRENETGRSFDIGHDHGSNLSLDIRRLVANRNLGDAREIHKRNVENIGRKNLQTNLLIRHTFVPSSFPISLSLHQQKQWYGTWVKFKFKFDWNSPEFRREFGRSRGTCGQASGGTRRTLPGRGVWFGRAGGRGGGACRCRCREGGSHGRRGLRGRWTCRCSGCRPPQPEGGRWRSGSPRDWRCPGAGSPARSPTSREERRRPPPPSELELARVSSEIRKESLRFFKVTN